MITRDAAFRRGDNIMIIGTNKPYVDLTIPPEANNYRPASVARVKFYNPCGELWHEADMCERVDQVGWYYYRLQTDKDFPQGLWKVEIIMGNNVPVCGQEGCDTADTTGSSGTPAETEYTEVVAINRFRLMDLEVF